MAVVLLSGLIEKETSLSLLFVKLFFLRAAHLLPLLPICLLKVPDMKNWNE
jgi:hypothetical protein